MKLLVFIISAVVASPIISRRPPMTMMRRTTPTAFITVTSTTETTTTRKSPPFFNPITSKTTTTSTTRSRVNTEYSASNTDDPDVDYFDTDEVPQQLSIEAPSRSCREIERVNRGCFNEADRGRDEKIREGNPLAICLTIEAKIKCYDNDIQCTQELVSDQVQRYNNSIVQGCPRLREEAKKQQPRTNCKEIERSNRGCFNDADRGKVALTRSGNPLAICMTIEAKIKCYEENVQCSEEFVSDQVNLYDDSIVQGCPRLREEAKKQQPQTNCKEIKRRNQGCFNNADRNNATLRRSGNPLAICLTIEAKIKCYDENVQCSEEFVSDQVNLYDDSIVQGCPKLREEAKKQRQPQTNCKAVERKNRGCFNEADRGKDERIREGNPLAICLTIVAKIKCYDENVQCSEEFVSDQVHRYNSSVVQGCSLLREEAAKQQANCDEIQRKNRGCFSQANMGMRQKLRTGNPLSRAICLTIEEAIKCYDENDQCRDRFLMEQAGRLSDSIVQRCPRLKKAKENIEGISPRLEFST